MRLGPFLIAILAWTLASASRAAPLEAYYQGPALMNVHISPDGKMLAYVAPKGDDHHVIVQTIDDPKPVADVDMGRQKLRDVQWAGSDRLLILTLQDDKIPDEEGGRYWEKTLARVISVKSHQQVHLMRDLPRTLNMIVGTPAYTRTGEPPTAVLVGYLMPSDGYQSVFSLFAADLETGKTKLLEAGVEDTQSWLADRDGKPVARLTYRSETRKWSIDTKKGPNWIPVWSGEGLPPRFEGFGPDQSTPILSFLQLGGYVLKTLAPTGEGAQVLPGPPYTETITEPSRQRIYGAVSVVEGKRDYHFLDPVDQARWNGILKAYPTEIVDWVSVSDDGRRWVIRLSSPTETPYYALVDLTSGKSRILADIYPAVARSDVSPTRRVTFRAADGLELDGYLTKPKVTRGSKPPLLVIPPLALDPFVGGNFDLVSQALAGQGYAVFRVNHRGLSSRALSGLDFIGSDIAAGVRQLIAQGEVDPSRICIDGRGYLGSYSAIASVIAEPKLYRCASTAGGGMFDLKGYFGDFGEVSQREWLARFGVQKLGDSKLQSLSPIKNPEKVQVPVQFIQTANTKDTFAEQARDLAKAIQKAGGRVEVINEDGNNELQALPSSYLKRTAAMVEFLRKNNPPD